VREVPVSITGRALYLFIHATQHPTTTRIASTLYPCTSPFIVPFRNNSHARRHRNTPLQILYRSNSNADPRCLASKERKGSRGEPYAPAVCLACVRNLPTDATVIVTITYKCNRNHNLCTLGVPTYATEEEGGNPVRAPHGTPQPTSYFLLPTSYFLLPTSYFLLPVSLLCGQFEATIKSHRQGMSVLGASTTRRAC